MHQSLNNTHTKLKFKLQSLPSKGLKKTTNNIAIKNKTLHAKYINLHCAHHPNQKAHHDDKNIAL
jgi:hypothetical protein